MGIFAEQLAALRLKLAQTTEDLFGVSQLYAVYSDDVDPADPETYVPLRATAQGRLEVVVVEGGGGGGGGTADELPDNVKTYVGRGEASNEITNVSAGFLGGQVSNTTGDLLWIDVYDSVDATGDVVFHTAVPSGAQLPLASLPGKGRIATRLSYAWSTSETTKAAPASAAGLSVTFIYGSV